MKNESACSFADAIILQVISKAKCYMMFLVPINPWYRHMYNCRYFSFLGDEKFRQTWHFTAITQVKRRKKLY
jgi:hypothetical protein